MVPLTNYLSIPPLLHRYSTILLPTMQSSPFPSFSSLFDGLTLQEFLHQLKAGQFKRAPPKPVEKQTYDPMLFSDSALESDVQTLFDQLYFS
jgi:hypothetical protein